MSEINYHKPSKNVIPIFYNVSFQPDLIKFKFSGKVSIQAIVKTETNVIIINQCELDITYINVLDHAENQHISIENFEFDDEQETLSIKFREPLSEKKLITIHLEYNGILNEDPKGFFTYPYVSVDGHVKYATATKFKPTFARRCFPCWDEPNFKAVFKITIKVPTGLIALSNMPLDTTSTKGKFTSFTFQNTPKMSTYLLVVVTGDFDYIEDKACEGIKIRIYTPRGKKNHGRFALEEITKSLPFYANYLKVDYSLPKLDCVALPDLMIPSTGNWGLVIFRTSCLLIDPESTATRYELSKRLLISHRLAQQWFGNLVTVKCWNDFGLFKALASFTEYFCLDQMYPENNTWQQFITEEFQKAITFDAMKDRTPLVTEIDNPQEVEYIFDEILCSKATSIIRMLEFWIGEDNFRKGISLYLNKYSYNNASIDELWKLLENVSSKPVREVMSTWTNQPGYPILKVKQRRENNDVILSVFQQHFVEDGTLDELLWMIPIYVKVSSEPDAIAITTILTDRETEITVPNVPKDAWIKINPSSVGFYRTLYCTDMLNAFIPFIKDKSMSPLVRFGFLDDLFFGAKAGYTSLGEVLTFLRNYSEEDNYIVWEIIANCLSQICALVCHLPISDKLKQFCRNMYNKIYTKVGWECKKDESHLDTLLRSLIIGKLVALSDASVLEKAKEYFELDLMGECTLPDHMKTRIYLSVLSHGDETVLDKVLDIYNKIELYDEKRKILSTLGVVNDEKLLKKVLNFSMSQDMSEKDTLAVFSVYSSHNHFTPMWSRLLAYQYIKDNWNKLLSHIYDAEYMLVLLKWITEGFMTEEMATDVEIFFQENVIPVYDLPGNECVEIIRRNIKWLERDTNSIEKFLNSLDEN